MKPSHPRVYSSLMLEHERYFGVEHQNCEKKEKAATPDLETVLQGKYSN